MAYVINPKEFNATAHEIYLQAEALCLDPEIYQGRILLNVDGYPDELFTQARSNMFFLLGLTQQHQLEMNNP